MEDGKHDIPGPPDGPAHSPAPLPRRAIFGTFGHGFALDLKTPPPGMEFVDLEDDAMPGAEGAD